VHYVAYTEHCFIDSYAPDPGIRLVYRSAGCPKTLLSHKSAVDGSGGGERELYWQVILIAMLA
jgi:hypothetical protein